MKPVQSPTITPTKTRPAPNALTINVPPPWAPAPPSPGFERHHSAGTLSPARTPRSAHHYHRRRRLSEPFVTAYTVQSPVRPSAIETDYDADTEEVPPTPPPTQAPALLPPPPVRRFFQKISLRNVPPLYRDVFKCALAYFIATLFTFAPTLSRLVGDLDSSGQQSQPFSSFVGPISATVVIYLHPVKSLSAMLERDMYCFLGLLFAFLLCLLSMALGNAGVVLLLGVSIGAMSWLQTKIMRPGFNAACTITSINLFSVIVMEGSTPYLLQVSLVAFAGIATSNLICFFVWPTSATSALRTDISATLGSFATLLSTYTSSFVLEKTLSSQGDAEMQACWKALRGSERHLKEAKCEWLFQSWGWGKAHKNVVEGLRRLERHLGGLRSSATLQYEMARTKGKTRAAVVGEDTDTELEENMVHGTEEVFFDELVDELRVPVKGLSTTCTLILQRLREPISTLDPLVFRDMHDGIKGALAALERTSDQVAVRIHRAHERTPGKIPFRENQILRAEEEVDEHVFLVYFFVFTLEEFARELLRLVESMGRMHALERRRAASHWWRCAVLSKGFWRSCSRCIIPGRNAGEKRNPGSLIHRLLSFVCPRRHYNAALQSKGLLHMHVPPEGNLSRLGQSKQAFGALCACLREPDLNFAVKAGIAMALLAALGFIDATKSTFTMYGGEWTLFSYFVVNSSMLRPTHFLVIGGILGTFFGATSAAGVYIIVGNNVVMLSTFGFFFASACFYHAIAKPRYLLIAKFALLTYNLTCLYCYGLRQHHISTVDVAWRRAIAVSVGIIWAIVVSRRRQPMEYPSELGELCMNVGSFYARLASFNAFAPEVLDSLNNVQSLPPTEETALLSGQENEASARLNRFGQETMSMELSLQTKLFELQEQLGQTSHESRFRDPLPVEFYGRVLTSLQVILDRLHSIRCVATRDEWHTIVARDFYISATRERRKLAGNIVLSLSIFSSAIKLKAPLSPYLPPAEEWRQRLIRAVRKNDMGRDTNSSGRLLFFAHAFAMRGVTQELDCLGRTLQMAFGQTPREFETSFRAEERVIDHMM